MLDINLKIYYIEKSVKTDKKIEYEEKI